MTTRPRDLRRAIALSVVSIVWNGVTGGAAVALSLATGGLSLLGFGFDAAVDAVASIALVWRFVAERDRPHRADQVERVATAVVCTVLVVLGLYLAFQAILALAGGSRHGTSIAAVALLVASVLVLPPLGVAKRRVADRLGSDALRADSTLTVVAALLAAIGLVSALLTETLGLWWADAVGGLIVAAVLVREGAAGLSRLARARSR